MSQDEILKRLDSIEYDTENNTLDDLGFIKVFPEDIMWLVNELHQSLDREAKLEQRWIEAMSRNVLPKVETLLNISPQNFPTEVDAKNEIIHQLRADLALAVEALEKMTASSFYEVAQAALSKLRKGEG